VGRYRILWEFFGSDNPDLLPWLTFDFRRSESRQVTPEWMGGRSDRSLENELIQSGVIVELLPELASFGPREIGRMIAVEELHFKEGTQKILFYYPSTEEKTRTLRLG
jgi:hypothetical protein